MFTKKNIALSLLILTLVYLIGIIYLEIFKPKSLGFTYEFFNLYFLWNFFFVPLIAITYSILLLKNKLREKVFTTCQFLLVLLMAICILMMEDGQLNYVYDITFTILFLFSIIIYLVHLTKLFFFQDK